MTSNATDSEAQCTMNFFSDWREMLTNEIVRLGYKTAPSDDEHTLFFKLFNIQQRGVPAAPRKIEVSKEFRCPLDLEPGLDEIKRKIGAGEDLQPHLSTALLKADYQDKLLSDWGILHFHLSTAPHPKLPGFNDRTGPLLFGRVTNDVFYMIDVKQHGAWTNTDLIEILHTNWPESISRYKSNTIAGIAYSDGTPPTAEERQALRDAGFYTFVELSDGTIYHPTGGGLTSAGTSIEATRYHDATYHTIKRLPERIRARLPEILKDAKDQGFQIEPPYRFKLGAFDRRGPIITIENAPCHFVFEDDGH